MDYNKKTRNELIDLCKESGIKGYSAKKKAELIELLKSGSEKKVEDKIVRLDYIGSKFKLLDWVSSTILEKTGWEGFTGKRVADLFAGTGVVSYHFRGCGATVLSNDAELYSSIIAHAFTRSTYSLKCKEMIDSLNSEMEEGAHNDTVGFVAEHYSPHGSERKFFTEDNAQRIDYMRAKLEGMRDELNEDEYNFLLASILVSADAVSNVPAVYGCFLKEFKATATRELTLQPIHTLTVASSEESHVYNKNVLDADFLRSFESDVVYLDPPYNERQYSKNYFPLNIIAKTPEQLLREPELKGKTGIPTDCFMSPFCKKGNVVEGAFDTLFRELKAGWVFLSYNSESIVSKDKMIEIMEKYGEVSVVERDYKRFKAFQYNKDLEIKEYLFCLKKAL
jgi:adenine-specific DNA-methyltransferase